MPACTLIKQVNAPPERVFAFLADMNNWERAISAIKEIEVLTPGPVGKGTRFKETRVMFGKEATETMEITAWDPPRSHAIEADSCGARFISTISIEPTGAGSTIRMHTRTVAQTFFAKLFAPLGYLMMGMMKKAMQKDLDDLAKAIETNK
ncbi:MAG: SRPBCC family protein [Phycisphaeraceae bacterium]|nr:SRPBCC family protein [Phycisphaeraceae bacterium]